MAEPLDTVSFDLTASNAPLKQVGAETEAYFDKLSDSIQKKTGSMFTPTKEGAAGAKKAIEDVDSAVQKTHGSVAAATREFRALFDELSSGRVRQTPGTLAIIATRVFGISGATLLWGVALAAIPVALAAAAASADQNLAKIRTQLALTGHASGVTASQIAAIGDARTRGIAGSLAGKAVPGQFLGEGAQAASNYSLATGEKLDKSADIIGKIFSDPAASAKELNSQMRLLNAAQTREVDDLQRRGQTEAAGKVVLDAFNARAKDAADQAGGLAKALSAAAAGAGNFWNALGRAISGAGVSDADKLASDNKKLGLFDQAGVNPQNGNYQRILAERNQLQASVTAEQQKASQAKLLSGFDQSIQGALPLAERNPMTKYREDAEKLKGGLAAARGELALFQDLLKKSPNDPALRAQVGGAQENVNDLAYGLAHQRVPGALKGPKYPGASSDTTVDDAQKNEIEAQLSLTRDIQQRAKLQADLYAIEDQSRKDALARAVLEKKVTASAAARATALDDQTRAARDQKAARELTESLQDEQLSYDKQIAGYKNQALQAAASLHITEAERVKIQAQILAADQQEARDALRTSMARNPNLTNAQKISLGFGLTNAQGAQASAQAANAAYQEDAPVRSLQNQIELQQKELDLKYADAGLRAKEIADIQTRNQLILEGFQKGTDAYNAEYARRAPLAEKSALLGAANDNPDAQMIGELRTGLTALAETGVKGFQNLKQTAQSFLDTLAEMALKLYVITPLLNSILGTQSGGMAGGASPGPGGFGMIGSLVGGVLTGGLSAGASLFGSIFGGGKATGGNIDPNKFYVVGENGPEILGGVGGNITPIKAPSAQTMAPGSSGSQTLRFEVNANVTGTGDNELKASMQQIAVETTKAGLNQYDKTSNRTQRGRLIQNSKRALP